MLGEKTIRKLLLTAVVVTLATTPVAAETRHNCDTTETHYGLFCNDGRDIEVCVKPDFECTVNCGQGEVDVDSC